MTRSLVPRNLLPISRRRSAESPGWDNGATGQISRRRLLSLLAGAGAAVGISACGGQSSPAGLAFSTESGAEDFAGAQLQAIMRDASFLDLNGVTVEGSAQWGQQTNASIEFSFPKDWREQYTRAAKDGVGPDIAEIFGSAPHLLADDLVDVSSIAEEVAAQLGDWHEFARDGAMVDGIWRAVPWAYTTNTINYREDFLTKIGSEAPETFDDLLEVATRLADNDMPRAAFSMSTEAANDSANFAYSMLWSFGGQEVDDTGKRVVLDSEGTRSALRYFRELAAVSDPRTASFDEFANNAAFWDESIAMTQNAVSIYASALESHPNVAAAMNHSQYPSGPAGNHKLVELNALGIFRHSRNQDAAASWIRSATSRSKLVQRSSASLGFFLPPILGMGDDPQMPWNFDDKLTGLNDLQSSAHMAGWPGPPNVEAALVYENGSIVRMFAGAGFGTDSIDELVRAATAELVRVYET